MATRSQRSGKAKRRLIVGGLIGGIAALLVWLGSLLPGSGLGLGLGGDGLGTGPVPTPDVKTPKPPVKKKKKKADPSRVLEVQIDKEGLRKIARYDGRTTYEPIEIDKVVEQAADLPGDNTGNKVHIHFRGTGIKETDRKLKDALDKAGIKYDRFTPDFQ